jgi:hypothetical protein
MAAEPTEPALFERRGDTLVPTDWSRGPWNHAMLHGGPVCGLAAAAVEAAGGDGLLCARMTVELHRAVGLDPITVSARVVKPGRRARVVDAELIQGGQVVARAMSQWVQRDALDGGPGPAPPPPVATVVAGDDFDYPRPGFNCDAVETASVHGSTEESGPAQVWLRLAVPLIAGEPTSRWAATATLSDLVAAAAWEEAPGGGGFINADVTLQLNRLPAGEWIFLDARSHAAGPAVGFNEALLADHIGPLGRVLQTVVQSPFEMPSRG